MAKHEQREFRFPVASNDFYKGHDESSYMSSFEPSKTRQEFAEECDINTIMERYEAGGAVSHVNKANPIYLDTTLYPDLRGSLDAFRIASEQFAALPAKVRREFDNDPQKFVDAATDDSYRDKFREWGLLEPEPVVEKPIRVEVVSPPVVPAAPGAPTAPDGA